MSSLQRQRSELKYLITEEKARCIRAFVRAYLPLDKYGVGKADCSYPTLSLYLDTDGLESYWDVVEGHRNRFKLRLRYYDERPDSPVFFEIKRRIGEIIIKDRAGVRKEIVPSLMAGRLPGQEDLLRPGDAGQLVALQNFCRIMALMRARPRMHVAYLREAYEAAGSNAARLTLDRQVESAPNPTPALVARSENPHRVFGQLVVLELKFTRRYPKWFQEMVELFDLTQTGAAKYAFGILERGEEWVNRDPRMPQAQEIVDNFLNAERYPRLFGAVDCASGGLASRCNP